MSSPTVVLSSPGYSRPITPVTSSFSQAPVSPRSFVSSSANNTPTLVTVSSSGNTITVPSTGTTGVSTATSRGTTIRPSIKPNSPTPIATVNQGQSLPVQLTVPSVRTPISVPSSSVTVSTPVVPSNRITVASPQQVSIRSIESPITISESPITISESVVVDAPVESAPKTINDLLAEKGFTVTDTVVIKHRGLDHAKYYKVKDDLGQTFFVELDMDGKVLSTNPNVMVQEDGATMVPASTVKSAFECASKGGCGVLFDCADGICVMSRPADSPDAPTPVTLRSVGPKAELKAVERGSLRVGQDGSVQLNEQINVQFKQEGGAGSIKVGGIPTPYPVVLLSSVLTMPFETKASVQRSIVALREASIRECAAKYSQLRMAIQKLAQAAKENYEWANQYMLDLNRSLDLNKSRQAEILRRSDPCILRSSSVTRLNSPALNEASMAIDRRSEQYIELFKLCEAVPVITSQIEDHVKALNESTSVIKENKMSKPTQ